MPDFAQTGSQCFFDLSRQVDAVVIENKDALTFITDTVFFDATSGMGIWWEPEKYNMAYESDPYVDVMRMERVLMFARCYGNQVLSSFRWVPYITDSDPDSFKIKPLREVYCPRISYDRSSNTVNMWFWTNFQNGYTGEYDEAYLYPVGYSGYQSKWKQPERVLCFTTGIIGHYYVEGGLISGYQGQDTTDHSNDIVPIFTRPRIVTSLTGGLSGLFTDGWYGIQSELIGVQATGPQGHQGPQGIIGPSGTRGARGPQGDDNYLPGGTGPQGDRSGHQGPRGSSGSAGQDGEPGPTGPNGPQGHSGPSGPSGTQAFDWSIWYLSGIPTPTHISTSDHQPIGHQGLTGMQGDRGLQGLYGAIARGPQGLQGDSCGPRGPQGGQGDPGYMGAQGLQGNNGPTGYVITGMAFMSLSSGLILGPQGPAGQQGLSRLMTSFVAMADSHGICIVPEGCELVAISASCASGSGEVIVSCEHRRLAALRLDGMSQVWNESPITIESDHVEVSSEGLDNPMVLLYFRCLA